MAERKAVESDAPSFDLLQVLFDEGGPYTFVSVYDVIVAARSELEMSQITGGND